LRVLLDTNIILDFFLEREPFFQDASMLFEAIASSQLEGFITASSATDIFYICRRQTQNLEEARQILTITLAILSVGSVDRTILRCPEKTPGIRHSRYIPVGDAEWNIRWRYWRCGCLVRTLENSEGVERSSLQSVTGLLDR
jgi:hypothetical protein